MTYNPFTGRLPETFKAGTEVLVTVQQRFSNRSGEFEIASVEVAFREEWDRTWSPPVQLVRAP